MKKLLGTFLLAAVIYGAKAQNVTVTPPGNTTTYLVPFKKFMADTAALRSFYQYHTKQGNNQNQDGMPVAGLNQVQLTYQYNNGKGLDIYKANVDNMPVAKPDSSFYSGMPVKQYSVVISPVNKK